MLKPLHSLIRLMAVALAAVLPGDVIAEPPVPRISGEWWQMAGNPDLGEYATGKQEPVDFGVWQAADGTWQLWSCIRNTGCGGHSRLFFRWEGRLLTDTNWTPKGIAMMAEPALGETKGGLQAPFVFQETNRFYMFYGDWERICIATSADGKVFTRKLNEHGQPGIFSGPYENTRDAMVMKWGGLYYCYYTGHKSGAKYQSAIFCRTSHDLEQWSEPMMVSAGGAPAKLGDWFGADAECPFVVRRDGMFCLFRNQFYGRGNLNTQYASPNPLDFGVGDDRCRIGTLAVAAPEIFFPTDNGASLHSIPGWMASASRGSTGDDTLCSPVQDASKHRGVANPNVALEDAGEHHTVGTRSTAPHTTLNDMLKRNLSVIWVLAVTCLTVVADPSHKTENIFLITVDGLRWQEVFTGMDQDLATREFGVWDTNRLSAWFWRDTSEERRQALMPFFWNTIAKQGQIYGNGNKGSVSMVTNGKNFTYPGFNEIFTGSPDDRIDKNEKRYNPNVSVLEWLNRKPEFKGRVVGFANWEVHPYILNTERSGIPVWSGFDTNFPVAPGSRLELIQQMQKDTIQIWYDMSFDSFYFHAAKEYIEEKQPRLVWMALSETDEWAHGGNYEHYLQAANNADRYIGKLWDTLQSLPAYKDKTTFIIACDHGRGNGAEWKNHGGGVVGAEKTWLAVIGPDTRPLGERTNISQVTHSQIAATLAALLGEDYHAAVPKSGEPIQDLLPAATTK